MADVKMCAARTGFIRWLLADRPLEYSAFYCVGKELDSNFEKICTSGYKKDATKCTGYISVEDAEKCGDAKCYMPWGPTADYDPGELTKKRSNNELYMHRIFIMGDGE